MYGKIYNTEETSNFDVKNLCTENFIAIVNCMELKIIYLGSE